MPVKAEYSLNTEPSHNPEACAVNKAQTAAVRRDDSLCCYHVLGLGDPLDMKNREHFVLESLHSRDSETCLDQGERLDQDVVAGDQRVAVSGGEQFDPSGIERAGGLRRLGLERRRARMCRRRSSANAIGEIGVMISGNVLTSRSKTPTDIQCALNSILRWRGNITLDPGIDRLSH